MPEGEIEAGGLAGGLGEGYDWRAEREEGSEMGESEARVVRCAWCRKRMPEGAEVCPHCRRAVVTDEFRPLGADAEPPAEDEGADPWAAEGAGTEPRPVMPAPRRRMPARPSQRGARYDVEPLPPAPGQESTWSWAYVKGIARADPIFGVLLGIMALGVLLNFLMGSVFGLVISGLIFWGVLSLQWWGYIIVMFGAGLGLLTSLGNLARSMVGSMQSGSLDVGGFGFAAVMTGINVFILAVLWTRRQHFT